MIKCIENTIVDHMFYGETKAAANTNNYLTIDKKEEKRRNLSKRVRGLFVQGKVFFAYIS